MVYSSTTGDYTRWPYRDDNGEVSLTPIEERALELIEQETLTSEEVEEVFSLVVKPNTVAEHTIFCSKLFKQQWISLSWPLMLTIYTQAKEVYDAIMMETNQLPPAKYSYEFINSLKDILGTVERSPKYWAWRATNAGLDPTLPIDWLKEIL